MIHPDFKFLRAVFMMIGGIVGVGVFGIPYAFAQSGFQIGFLELLVVGLVLLSVQFMYAEIALQTEGHTRLVGYVKKYLGHPWNIFCAVAVCVSVWGAMLAYMIIGGKFLFHVFSPVIGGSILFYSYGILCIAALLIYRGLRFASYIESFVMIVLLSLFVFLIILCIPSIQFSHLAFSNPSKWFLPYGVILFALSSVGIVPEMREVLGLSAKKNLLKAILYGFTIIVVLYALFAFAIVGVSGGQTTNIAFDGLIPLFGSTFILIASVLGSMTVLSIFMMLGIQLQNILQVDFFFSKKTAWMVTVLVPFLVFAFGVREFISIIGFIGSIFGGIIGIFIVSCYLQMKKRKTEQTIQCFRISNRFAWIAICFFLGGIFFTLYSFLL